MTGINLNSPSSNFGINSYCHLDNVLNANTSSSKNSLFSKIKRCINSLLKPDTLIIVGGGLMVAGAITLTIAVPIGIGLMATGAGLIGIGCIIKACKHYRAKTTAPTQVMQQTEHTTEPKRYYGAMNSNEQKPLVSWQPVIRKSTQL